jgi:hypothetical protein
MLKLGTHYFMIFILGLNLVKISMQMKQQLWVSICIISLSFLWNTAWRRYKEMVQEYTYNMYFKTQIEKYIQDLQV